MARLSDPAEGLRIKRQNAKHAEPEREVDDIEHQMPPKLFSLGRWSRTGSSLDWE